MEKPNYGIIKAKKPEFPQRDLLRVPHKEGILTFAYPAFGPNTYKKNLEIMSEGYSHSKELPKISFRPAITSESISAAAYNFEHIAKPLIFDLNELQAGRIVKTSEGVFVNPPKDEQGNPIIDEKILKYLLDGGFVNNVFFNKAERVNGIYLGANDFGFASYETFERGVQDSGKFAEGGLARILEHTMRKVAKNLKMISSSKNYPNGVNVGGFDEVKEPVLRVAGLYSGGGVGGVRLGVSGDDWGGDRGLGGVGYTFGVLK